MNSIQQKNLLFELCSSNLSDKEKEAIMYILENQIDVDQLIRILNDPHNI